MSQIPGYYFDESRNRWFKVDSDDALPASQKYSSDIIRQNALKAEAQKKAREHRDARKHLIRKIRLDHSATLREEVTGSFNASRTSWLAQNLVRQKLSTMMRPVEDFHVVISTIDHKANVWIGSSQNLTLRNSTFEQQSLKVFAPGWSITTNDDSVIYSGLSSGGVALDSLEYLSAAIAIYDNEASGLPVLRIVDHPVQRSKFPDIHTIETYTDARGDRYFGAIFSGQRRAGSLLTAGQLDGHRLDAALKITSRTSDILAFCFLDSSKVACGTRAGNILVTDTRLPHPHIQLFSHGSSIVDLKRGRNEYSIIAAGLKSHLAMYDTRMLPPHAVNESAINVVKWTDNAKVFQWDRLADTGQLASPVVTFPQYSNESDPQLRIAVHEELGLVASGNDTAGTVAIFSLDSGALLRKIGPGHFSAGTVRRLQWVDDEYGVPWLYFAQDKIIERWGVDAVDEGLVPQERRRKRARDAD
ncbi:hypothetical protein P152DRAFT_516408 [Eremomyces bilateralis CBS 781.70]|uniref:WD40 repeat-like protein n=1 Tax=Eremomyces bilateralis CBS 781.70 TaxID=1392243 RepID=A0A6G1FW43_9PEZI|nr:uncharacterized protein P152DRAFT_516408 [Eremomyces bilateralis CBS 781.70]KAF1810004.1 hypothetical protein P152DRAFT_516408 [Eremomyces bilateralis CBS 781.70]